MIKHDCYRFGGSESVGSSDTRLEFVVQALDGTERDFVACLEPIQDKRLVPERVNDFETPGRIYLVSKDRVSCWRRSPVGVG